MLHHRTIAAHAKALRRGEYSSTDLTQHYLTRIQTSPLNAYITPTPDLALKQAQAADTHLKSDPDPDQIRRPLLGIPLAHKDLFCTAGILTTCASNMLHNFIAPYTATAIQKIADAGAVMLGKTNMDEFAMGSSNETSCYGAVKNPWNPTRVPGGSSGGSAAAVAAGLAAAATATDTGGSIRQPAAFCGLTGIKPSYGRISRYGMVAFASSLDQAGVLTRTAEDAAHLLRAMCGHDPHDSTSLNQKVPDYPADLTAKTHALKGKTIGLPKQFFPHHHQKTSAHGIAPSIATAIDQAINQLQTLGAKTKIIDLPNAAAGIPCYYVLAPAEAASNLARFDGVRYGHRTEAKADQDLNQMYRQTRSQGFGEEVQRRILTGTYVLSAGYYDAYYLKAQKLRRLIADDFHRAFTDHKCDLLAGPTTPTTAFALGEKTQDPIAMYHNDIFTNAVNLAGLPAISIPAGQDENALPIGLHLIAPYLHESRLLSAAHQFQCATDWHQKTPPEQSKK